MALNKGIWRHWEHKFFVGDKSKRISYFYDLEGTKKACTQMIS